MTSNAGPAQPSLVVSGGARDGDTLVLDAPLVEKLMGSGSNAHLRVEAKNVDAIHAMVAWEARGIVLTDQGSSTGTFVNGERVRDERLLQDGDTLCLGPPGSRETLTLVLRLPPGFEASAGDAEPILFVGDDEGAAPSADEPLNLSDAAEPPKPVPAAPAGSPKAAPPSRAATPSAASPSPQAIIFDEGAAPPAASPPAATGVASPAAPARATPSARRPDYQTDVSIGGDRVRAPLEVPAVAPPVRARPKAPVNKRGAGLRLSVPPVVLVAAGAVALLVGGYFAFSRFRRPPPVLTAVAPLKAEPGGTVTIRGTGFVPEADGQTVRFGDVTGKVTAATDSQITATLPEEVGSLAEVPVVVERGRARSNALSLKIARVPWVTRIEPDVMLPGGEITVQGQNLTGKTVGVRIGAQRGDVKSAEPTRLRVAVPEMAWTEGQSVPVVVEVGPDASRPVPLFFGRMPLVVEVSPGTGPVGQRVTLKGRGFDPVATANKVTFGGERALVLSATATEIQAAVPVPPGGAPPGPMPVVVEARGGTSAGQAQFALARPSTALYRPRFFPALTPQSPDRFAFVSSELGPLLVLTGRGDATSVGERAFKVAGALTAAMDAVGSGPVSVEVRAGAVPTVALQAGAVLVTATAEDGDGYAQPWDSGVKPSHPSPAQLATYWAAMIQDYLNLFGLGQRPTHTVEVSNRGKVLLDIYADAERRGLQGGIPIAVLTGLTPASARAIRELAFSAPSGGGGATPAAAVAGRWEGSMDDAGTERSMALQLRMEGPRLAGSLTTKTGALAVDIPLSQLTYDKGLLKFVASMGGASRQFLGKVEGATLTGEIKDGAGKQSIGRFNARYVE